MTGDTNMKKENTINQEQEEMVFAEQGDTEKNYLEGIQVHEQKEGDFEYVHLKTGEKRWFHNIAMCCEINGKKKV